MDRVVAPRSDEDFVTYDLWSRVVGITTFQDEILRAVLKSVQGYDLNQLMQDGKERRHLDLQAIQPILDATAAFLRRERVVEISTGETITNCYFVRVDKQLLVAEVLAVPTGQTLTT